MIRPTSVLVLWALWSGWLAAEESKPPVVIPVVETAMIEAHVGKRATIRGKVTRTGESKTGIQFLNFSSQHFFVVSFPDAAPAFEANGRPVDLYDNKLIEITGTIEKYRERFQIKLTEPKQVKIVTPSKDGKVEPKQDAQTEEESELTPNSKKERKPNPVDPKRFFDGG